MRRLRSIARIAAVYLFFGLVTTWAVAWGLALLPPGPATRGSNYWALRNDRVQRMGIGSSQIEFNESRIDMGVFENTSPIVRTRPQLQDESPGWEAMHEFLDPPGSDGWGLRANERMRAGDYSSGTDDARGFPFLALWCGWPAPPRQTAAFEPIITDMDRHLPNSAGSTPRTLPSLVGGFAIPDHVSASGIKIRRALPYMPIWSGLILNTLFYALLFFLTVRALRTVQQIRRFNHGVCPRCKYDRQFDYRTPCPECGFLAPAARAAHG